MKSHNGRTVFFVGHAKLPQGMPACSIYDRLAVSLEVDCRYGVVVEAACTLATEHGREFISSLLVGYSLEEGIDDMVEAIKQHYKGAAQNAFAAALKDIYNSYLFYKKKS